LQRFAAPKPLRVFQAALKANILKSSSFIALFLPTSQPASQPAASQPASQPASRPASQPASRQPASQPPASQPASQPAGPLQGAPDNAPGGLGPKIAQNQYFANSSAIFHAGGKHCLKLQFSTFLGPFSGLWPKNAQNSSFRASWVHFPGWDQKLLKIVVFEHPGATFQAADRHASKFPFSSLLGPFSGLGPKIAQN